MRSALRSRLHDLERDHAALRNEAGQAAGKSRLLEDAMSALPVGVLVLGPGGEVVIENVGVSSPTVSMGMNLLAREAALNAARECARTGRPVAQELNLHGPPAHDFQITAQPLGAESVVCVMTDVSERRRLADMRRDFTINASHELRTPIGAIALLAETLEQEEDAANVRLLASHLVREAERARALLEGVLDLARLEARHGVERDEVDLGWVARQATTALSPLARRSGVELRLDLADPVSTIGSADQLVSAVTNLVDNAIKYSAEGGWVTVAVRRDETRATIEVRDQGVGIPSRDLGRVFERFYRVDRGRDRRTGGSGLGLAIVRHVAENHGGHVTVESREGHGSVFSLVLPVSA